MKTATDPRHLKRRETVRYLFAYAFEKNQPLNEPGTKIIANLDRIDQKIIGSAPEWPLERINKIDLAILRLAVYELLIQKSEPPKVIIDEAVELAKEFGAENSAAFINGVLGSILKKKEVDNGIKTNQKS
ncbi:MAG TPA: transcription antitermination factor NusB [Patescibacteria group bacterium]|nr:transcription antitermination factor NusB [Patescibacteria group bacterium]